MSVVLGVDVGGSTTKIVALDESGEIRGLLQVRAGDQLTSLFGAMGNLLYSLGLSLKDVRKIVLTGVGAARVDRDLYGIPTEKVAEFEAIGRGGLLLSNEKEAMIISMGTGTAFVHAGADGSAEHVGGSAIGGGTLMGLAYTLLEVRDMDAILNLAAQGDLANVDLTIRDITCGEIPSLPPDVTAASFGSVKSTASKGDLALGLINMVIQNAGVLAAFAANGCGMQTIVATGTLATIPQAREILDAVGNLYGLRYIVPENAAFATALGAATLAL